MNVPKIIQVTSQYIQTKTPSGVNVTFNRRMGNPMGEIADMMLDGTLCQCCGVYIGDVSLGDFPQYCESCAKEVAKQEKHNDDE
jgi:hypothetical protein